MSLIDFNARRFWGSLILKRIPFGGRRIPEASIINRRHSQILGNTFDPSRETFDPFPTRGDHRYLSGLSAFAQGPEDEDSGTGQRSKGLRCYVCENDCDLLLVLSHEGLPVRLKTWVEE